MDLLQQLMSLNLKSQNVSLSLSDAYLYLNTSDNGPSPAVDVTESEMLLFLAVTVKMLHDIQHSLKDYCSITDQLHHFTAKYDIGQVPTGLLIPEFFKQ